MYEPWIDKEEIRTDCLAIETVQRYEALMDRDPLTVKHDDMLDPGLQWLFFTPIEQQYAIGSDGIGKKGDFLPPVTLPKRMWGGGKMIFNEVLMLGELTEKISTIKSIEEKEGSSGRLCFVTINHQYQQNDAVAIEEEQIVIYREASTNNAYPVRTKSMDIEPEWKSRYTTDNIILFRFSALTYNGHRIHYDETYAREVEGYPTLVVHGPLMMILLLECFAKQHPERTITEVEYRAVGPVYNREKMTFSGQDKDNNMTSCRVCGPDDKIALQAEIIWK